MNVARICSSMGVVTVAGGNRGKAVLIGIDRVILPAHLVSGHCLEQIAVAFVSNGQRTSFPPFKAASFQVVDLFRDFAIVQLQKNALGYYPGEVTAVAPLSFTTSSTFILADVSSYQWVTDGASCFSESFCSTSATEAGDSGRGCFNSRGELFAIHIAQSNGLCSGIGGDIRRSLLLHVIANAHPKVRTIFSMPPCQRLPSVVTSLQCLPRALFEERCFAPQGGGKRKGGRPACNNKAGKSGEPPYWEWHPKNCIGGGPRGISVPTGNQKVTYRFDLNPHDIRAYNKNNQELYKMAYNVVEPYLKGGSLPQSFTFEAYGFSFKAEKTFVETYR